MSGDPLSLYFHVPFCNRKCPYCHFYVIPNRPDHRQALLEAFLLELAMRPILSHQIVSIYFGGGTPTLLGAKPIATLLSKLPKAEEVTIEANPEDVTLELMQALHDAGVNRVSIGVQSLQDDSLLLLERTHSAKKAIEAIELTYKAGIQNISIDLMYELPDQSFESFQKTLLQLGTLPITHLSLYNLTIEPHTPFSKRKLNLPSQESGLQMLNGAISHLEQLGLKRYEISAFCKPGFESLHNTGYWKARPFFGFGPSAFSYYEKVRFRNVCHLHRYINTLNEGRLPIDFEETLPYPNNVHELLAVRLRLIEGAKLDEYSLPPETLKTLENLKKDGFLEERLGRVCLTEKGLLFYDTVAAEII